MNIIKKNNVLFSKLLCRKIKQDQRIETNGLSECLPGDVSILGVDSKSKGPETGTI